MPAQLELKRDGAIAFPRRNPASSSRNRTSLFGLERQTIVHVLTRFIRGGSEENTVSSALWQVEQGHHVTILHGGVASPFWVAKLTGRVALQSVPELVHPISPVQDIRAIRALRTCFMALRPDVIHTHQSKAGILGRIAAGSYPKAVVIHGIHIVPFASQEFAKRTVYLVAEHLAARSTDHFIAVSQGTGMAYLTAGICRPEQLTIVHSGMQLAHFRNADLPEDAVNLIGCCPAIESRPPIILMLAALEPRKRHVAFLETVPRILKRFPTLRVILAGAGPEEEAIRSAINRLGLATNVVLCGHRDDPQKLLALSDLTVLTSEKEGLPRVAIQSIASGRPIVVTEVDGIDEIVKHRINGIISPAHDLDQTADVIADLLSDRDELARLGAGARATDLSSWDIDRFGASTLAVYAKATAKKAI